MATRRLFAVCLMLGMLPALFVAPALAGGWAVATLDTLPPGGLHAGETYRMGYTIRQHGQTPFDGATTEIRARSLATSAAASFRGVPGDGRGRYVAEVRFPAAGEWTWLVTQEPFAPQELGTLTVLPPLASPGTPPVVPASARTAVPVPVGALGTLAVAGLLAGALAARRRRHPVSGAAHA